MAFSGGMDSTGLLIRLIADGFKVTCISYNYGQKHIIEIDRAIKNIKYLTSNNIELKPSDYSLILHIHEINTQ